MRAKIKNKRFIVFGKPEITQNDIKSVQCVLMSGWLGRGPKTEEFEKKFAEYQNTKYALATNSCTSALFLALEAVGVGYGDEVITTPITFAATANVIEYLGARPVFVDIDRKTLNINPKLIESAITKKTKAIIPVHFAGRPCEMKKIRAIAKKHNLYVIADAAHAIETEYYSKKVAAWADMSCYSFYPTKNITTGDGGMVVTNNKKWIETMKIKSMHGLSKDAWKRYQKSGSNFYEVVCRGFHFSSNDIAASLGLSQLSRINKNWQKRKILWEKYCQLLSNVKEIKLPSNEGKKDKHARHLFTILLDIDNLKINREKIVARLKEDGIGTGIHFLTLHLQKYYQKKLGHKRGDFLEAEYVSDRTLSLPLDVNLEVSDIKRIVDSLKKILI